MTKKSLKREGTATAEDTTEEVIMPSSMNPRRKSRGVPANADTEMADAPTVSTNSFVAMPTPSSFAEGLSTNSQREYSIAGSQYYRRSEAPSADTGLNFVGRRVQVLIDAINDFRRFGVDQVISLPELVLVGDQSAGKSSLMGALAEIHLPQSAGCCTRCPAHIKTAPAEVWSCKVSLEQSYAYEPLSDRPLDSRDVTRNRPFPPWKEQQTVFKPFKTIHDKKQLEEVLKWAQIATLNHNIHHALYIPGTDNFANDAETEAKFSPNVVSVEISGPGLVPLSFYDLPGIFQNAADKKDQYLVKVIENLAIKYIKRPQALIICALPMSADAATSRTAKVIADCNAEDRCIGVLTKADQLQDGQSYADFERMLQGQQHIVGHGYYVTKLPGSSVAATYDEHYHTRARIAEDQFFTSQSPWDSDWSEFSSRFGTRNLSDALSKKFALQIAESIPDIERKIYIRRGEIDQALMRLPELPSQNILHVVLQNLSSFSSRVQSLLDGGSANNDFQSSWRQLCEQFREAILEMRPMITVADDSDRHSPEVINLDDDDVAISTDSSAGNNRKRFNDETPTPIEKKAKVESFGSSSQRSYNGSFFQAPQSTPRENSLVSPRGNGIPHRLATPNGFSPIHQMDGAAGDLPNPFAPFLTAGKNFATIGEIRSRISRHSKTGVPGIVNDRVHMEMCLQAVTPWEHPLEKMVDTTLQMLREHTKIILNEVLSKWGQTQLYKKSRDHIETFFDEFETSQRAAATMLYELESYKLFTVNSLAWEAYRQEELDILRRARRGRRARCFVEKQVIMRQRQPFKDEAAKKKAAQEVKDEQLGKDPFATEIEVAAYVRGYYKTAGLRFVDSVCLSIHGRLFRNAREKIFYFLEQQLGLDQGDGEQRCRELMEENTTVAARRAALKKEKESLEKFTERLRKLARDNAELDSVEAQTPTA